jgi:uncharacterized phiE125 gp8 family phage protein
MRSLNPVEHLITQPILEPLDLEEVKKAIQFTSDTDDTLIDTWISASRQRFETQTGRQILTATWELWLDRFPCGGIELTKAPLQSVTSVKYIDTDGTLQTMDAADYAVKTPQGPQCDRGWIEPAFGETWPSTRDESGAVRIRYSAGYGSAQGDVPELVRSALYLLLSDFWCSRCANDDKPVPRKPIGMDDLLGSFLLRSTRDTEDAW